MKDYVRIGLLHFSLFLITLLFQRLDKRGGRGGHGPPGIFQDQAILVLLAPLRLENQAFLGLFWVLAPPEI